MELRSTGFLVTLALGLFTAPLAEAQLPGRVYRVGYLGNTPPTTPEVARLLDAFSQGLRARGWIEGQNIVIERRYSAGKSERFPEMAAELIRLNVDVIATAGAPATLAASKATTTIPIVFVAFPGPVEHGLIASLARPGGNLTGLSYEVTPQITAKGLELLKEALPRASRVAYLRDPGHPGTERYLKEVEVAARALGMKLEPVEARSPEGLEAAFAALTRDRPDALLVAPVPLNIVHRKSIAEFAARNRLPSAYNMREFVDAGGLMSYGPSFADIFWRAAAYVDKILRGDKPAELPVEQPMTFELVINLKTAKALGLTIPPSILLRTDQVIE